MQPIILSVWDGQLSIVSAPAKTVVILRDYEIDPADYADDPNLKRDNDGDLYVETELSL